MYVPSAFGEHRESVIDYVTSRFPFATVITSADGVPTVSHLPLIVRREGNCVRVTGHMARANDHWRLFDDERRTTMCVFSGPHAYVSPTWYETAPAVPTWNYAVVHVSGHARPIADPDALLSLLQESLDYFEPGLNVIGENSYLPTTLRDNLIKQVVGFEIVTDRVEAQFKLGQNRSAGDRGAVATRFASGPHENAPMTELLRILKD